MEFYSLDSTHILKIDEDITMNNMRYFQEKMEQFLERPTHNLILDLNYIKFISNSAFAIIFKTAKLAKQKKKEFVIVALHPFMKEIVSILKLDKYVKFFLGKKQAIEYFKKKNSI